jgi:hypothetical protein
VVPAGRRLPTTVHVVIAVVFALTPWVTLGFGTPFAFAVATAYRRSKLLGVAAILYGLMLALEFSTRPHGPFPNDAIFGGSIVALMVGGGIHAAFIGPSIVRGIRGRGGSRRRAEDLVGSIANEERLAIASDPALRMALRRRERRRRAREIAASDPMLSAELGLGRPDRIRQFDDGGLIDINRVPSSVLAELPGFDQAMADRVVRARERFEGLRSGADLVVHAGVPTEVVERVSDRLLFGAP